MGGTRKCYHLGRDPAELSARTPGVTGFNDAGNPQVRGHLGGDTPRPSGSSDYALGELSGTLSGEARLHVTMSYDERYYAWDYDPERRLDDPLLEPNFVKAAHQTLTMVRAMGLRPRVHDAYRTPEESDRKHAAYLAGQGGKASPAWSSAHNYGLGMDIWLYSRKLANGEMLQIDNHTMPGPGWYKLFKKLADVAIAFGFLWGEKFDDSDHFEFHPKWEHPIKLPYSKNIKAWAMRAAVAAPDIGTLPDNMVGPVAEPTMEQWLPFFWWAAGAGGKEPPADFLKAHPPPRDH